MFSLLLANWLGFGNCGSYKVVNFLPLFKSLLHLNQSVDAINQQLNQLHLK